MYLDYEQQELLEVLKTFFTVTGLRIVLFDTEFNKVLAYPDTDCEFCAMMKSNETGAEECKESDVCGMKAIKSTGELSVYRCHAGLIEVAMPIREEGEVIGYIVFGQVTDNEDRTELIAQVKKIAAAYGLDCDTAVEKAKLTPCQSPEKISAAAKLLEISTSYIILKELVTPESDKLMSRLDEYIDSHASEDLRVPSICRALDISRTRLYELFSKSKQTGIAEYVRYRRIRRAKHLLRTTNKAVATISEEVGFSDYNYFCRVFKKLTGRSPVKYRKLHTKHS